MSRKPLNSEAVKNAYAALGISQEDLFAEIRGIANTRDVRGTIAQWETTKTAADRMVLELSRMPTVRSELSRTAPPLSLKRVFELSDALFSSPLTSHINNNDSEALSRRDILELQYKDLASITRAPSIQWRRLAEIVIFMAIFNKTNRLANAPIKPGQGGRGWNFLKRLG